MKRRLYSTLAALSLLIAVTATVIWGWSYSRLVVASYASTSWTGTVAFCQGEMGASFQTGMHGTPGWEFRAEPSALNMSQQLHWHVLGFGFHRLGPTAPGYAVTCPLWFMLSCSSVLPLAWWLRWRKPRPDPSQRPCPSCGYDLRASHERCPECGKAIDSVSPAQTE